MSDLCKSRESCHKHPACHTITKVLWSPKLCFVCLPTPFPALNCFGGELQMSYLYLLVLEDESLKDKALEKMTRFRHFLTIIFRLPCNFRRAFSYVFLCIFMNLDGGLVIKPHCHYGFPPPAMLNWGWLSRGEKSVDPFWTKGEGLDISILNDFRIVFFGQVIQCVSKAGPVPVCTAPGGSLTWGVYK